MASDFGLRESDLFGGMSDHAFGLEPKATTMNADMTELVESVCTTVRAVKEVETMGTLYQALCQLESNDKTEEA
ncbi:hypothetical protein PybrP1_000800 [[Pythium] brassicae (nom. inval.)]|nr:hypothetical protein PybrP1_000800 [[Pythium] brassicae (nom. inval.)]